jgi:secondary thiamine-phosphate synthase enzyme
MRSVELELDTSTRTITDLTPEIRAFCRDQGDGLLNVFVPHATAGLAIMELGAASDADLEALLEQLLPHDDRYRHAHGSRGHGADHLLPALLSPSLVLPVMGGEPALGVWQSVAFVDTNRDNPTRHVRLTFLASA